MSGHGGKRGKKHEEHEEHENHERWAVSYADMMTVLMALFLVLFAMSNVDQKKYLELKTSLAEGFGQEVLPTDGGSGVVDGSTQTPVDVGSGAMSGSNAASDTQISSTQGKAAEDAAKDVDDLKRLQQQVEEQLRQQDLLEQVTTTVTERGLVISVAANNVFFANGSATIEPAGLRVLDVVSPLLLGNDRQIAVEGHTNNLAISDGRYANNWELSAARATSVLLRLATDGVPTDRLRLTGMADQHPLFPDDDPRALEGNRRVDIVLLAKAPTAEEAATSAAVRAASEGAAPSGVKPSADVGAVPHLAAEAEAAPTGHD
ncbi:flagellar motor protein MotB [Quadrisphaera sp. KR29]|uniref:flagellar motor protein MotB n=1 Tax=Quadrisphaera sp. KR29 TaxID=3461391 RepID=UPI0040448130